VSETAQRVRDAVAARYRQSPSYSDALATPPPAPQRVVEPQPQHQTLPQAPPQKWIDEPLVAVEPVAHMQSFVEETPAVESPAVADDFFADSFFSDPDPLLSAAEQSFASFEVRPFDDLPAPASLPERMQPSTAPAHPDELQSLDEEIAFRLAPEFVDHLIEPLPIQANIIEFPRQLVASRKQRPRLAEGPLRSDETPEYRNSPPQAEPPSDLAPASNFQMRIFEVAPRDADWSATSPSESIAETTTEPAVPATVVEPAAPEWQSLVLDAHQHEYLPTQDYTRGSRAEHALQQPREQLIAEPELASLPVARFELRLMSALVDAACIGMAFVVFATVTALTSSHALEGVSQSVLIAAGVVLLLVLTVLYQAMFFTLGASTLGMYYAHLEFRTVTGRQPSRGNLRRRITANLLAGAPLGLGLLWSLVDGRSLGWNDKLSGIFLQEL
jgi:hypothetical protein